MRELIFFLGTAVLSFLLTGAILRFSLRRSLLDMPTERGSHEVPKPRLGGAAIVLSLLIAVAVARIAGFDPLPVRPWTAVLGAAVMIAVVGIVDDIRGLDARFKLVAQLAAAGAVIASGVVLEEIRLPLIGTLSLGPAAVPFTLIWITAIVNFYNFIDGLDGLAAGIGMIAALFLVLLGYAVGNPAFGMIYAILSGSLSGFLRYNFPPARIFMGDCGSTFIGFLFAVLSIAGTGQAGGGQGVPAVVTILLMGGVLVDAALTLVRRALQRKKLFAAHRTHYYQRLTNLGLSHKQVTLLEYLIAALLGGSAFLLVTGEREFITGLAVIWTGFFLWAVFRIRKLEKGVEDGNAWRMFAGALTDLILITGSYILSYSIRLNFDFSLAEMRTMVVSLPLMIVVRTAVFYYYGLYKSVWRYTTFDDIVRIFRAVAVGTAVMVILFTFLFRFDSFPRSVFLIDLFILAVFMGGARVVTRWFHELPAHEEVEGRRIVIGETGHLAEAILHRVKQTKGLQPVGWLDDRRAMRGRMIHGIPVLGSMGEIESIAAHHGVDEIVISASWAGRVPPERFDQLERYGVPVRVLGDPAEEYGRAEGLKGPLAGKNVVAAGSGSAVRSAPAGFGRAARLTVITDELLVLRESSAFMEAPAESYFGILEDRDATVRTIGEIAPDVVVADFDLPSRELTNPTGAFLRKVVLPLERVAAAAEASGSRMILISRTYSQDRGARDMADDIARASRLGEQVVRAVFRGAVERLTVVRTDGTASAAALADAFERLFAEEGDAEADAGRDAAAGSGWIGGGRTIEAVSNADHADVGLMPVDPGPEAGDAAAVLMELSRAMASGETEKLSDILARFVKGARVEEHRGGGT